MTTESNRIAETIEELRQHGPLDLRHRGPVPLSEYFAEMHLAHVALPTLTRGNLGAYLQSQGVPAMEIGDPNDSLAGFVFVAGRFGWAFVNAADSIPRRRFTAAHELGHFLLHRHSMGSFRADTNLTLREAGEDIADQMEREANQFAVELLMPTEVCLARAEELRETHGCCPRGVLGYRLASELLVSREAMRYRLTSLGVGDE